VSVTPNPSEPLLVFNGIDGRTGRYLAPPRTPSEVLDILRQRPRDAEKAVMPGIDARNLAEAGWGVVFHRDADPAMVEALRPLLDHRRAQAGEKRYGVLEFQPGDTKESFLARLGAAAGPVNPDRAPYYMLLVGDPESIPYSFQYALDVQYAVGRIAFGTPERAARYAESVVAAEKEPRPRPRRVALFGPRNPGDWPTELSADLLLSPLAERLREQHPDWAVDAVLAGDATKARLGRLLGGEETPAFLFTASHGMGFEAGDPWQRDYQGALLCQDWPGPEAECVTPDHWFSAADVGPRADVRGLITFHFACYGAGTPQLDDFAHQKEGCGWGRGKAREAIAPQAFLSRLPERLLADPNGGALAVVGHVERAWGYSFLGKGNTSQIDTFASTLQLLLEGWPIGAAMEFFNVRYADLATDVTAVLYDLGFGGRADPDEIAGLWTAHNDARAYAVIGDPAVRLPGAAA
jgi:hypothetical protein